jgi:hypothetical protein
MMRLLLLISFLALPLVAQARTAVVKSGEHAGYSRLVITNDRTEGWRLFRTATGYVLDLPGPDQRFDVSDVFRLIPRDRLNAIWVDPETGKLQLGVGCDCHATAVELRPGVLVIDIHDGPGSAQEFLADGSAAPPLQGQPRPQRPKPRPREGETENALPPLSAALPKPLAEDARIAFQPPANRNLEAARDSLLRDLSKGAAQGLVDISGPRPENNVPPASEGLPIRIGTDLGMIAATNNPERPPMTATGAECPPEDALNIADWSAGSDALSLIGRINSGLTGEFDRPDQSAVLHATKAYLYLGFGAEARVVMSAFDLKDKNRPLWQDIAAIMDNETATDGRLAEFAPCDNAAALWSLLSAGDASVNLPAMLRGFSALPSHLRAHLGPRLVEKLTLRGDAAAAKAVHDATLRGAMDDTPDVGLMKTTIALSNGEAEQATQLLQDLAATNGPAAAEALIRFVDLETEANRPIATDTATTLSALEQEHRGTDLEPRLRDARVLALAATGRFSDAFLTLQDGSPAEPKLWRILAASGKDEDIINHGISAKAEVASSMPETVRIAMAKRLLSLGFADSTLDWIGDPQEPEARLIAAQADLQRRDSRNAMRRLAGLSGDQADELRAQAADWLRDPAAATIYERLGNDDAAARSLASRSAWTDLAKRAESLWTKPARRAADTPSDLPEEAPLAKAQALIAESAEARKELTELLMSLQ